MRRTCLAMIALSTGLLACLQMPAISSAAESPAEPPKFDSPAAVISAAEDAFVKRDFKAYADCFDATGQKILNEGCIQMLTVFAELTPDGHGKDAKAMLTKYGLTDLSKKGDESDDHYTERLAGQLKDPRNFLAESMPLVNTDSYEKPFPKGTLSELKIDGSTAKAIYTVKAAPKDTQYQAMTFAQTGGSWKITSDMNFPPPIEINNR